MDGSLVPSNGGASSNFAQQGSVDWVALSGSTLSFSIDVLSRFSKAGVEMITVAMGQALFSGFRLRPDGEKRFSDAISKLKACSSYGSVLWFGFGVKHVIRTLSETQQGAACAAMCACLSVSYDSLFSSQVLKALADRQIAPETLTPSLSQWAALVSVCSGAVTDSQFPKLVEGMSRLLDSTGKAGRCFLQEPTSVEALSGALGELAKISRGDVRSATLTGGVDCGWLAAVAQWLLSLSVDILDENGLLLYSNRSPLNPSYAQVTFIRSPSFTNTHAVDPSLVRRSFWIPPGKLCFEIQHVGIGDRPSQHLFSLGRSDWSTILHDTFSQAISILLGPENLESFANFLYSGFAGSTQQMNPWRGHAATARTQQHSHMSFASQRLPELKAVYVFGEHQSMQQCSTFGQPLVDYFPGTLRRVCPCSTCRILSESSSLPQNALFTQFDPSAMCLERAATTIFEYIWILSWLDIEETIQPSVSGLRMLYLRRSHSGINHSDAKPESIKEGFLQRPLVSTIVQLFTGHTDSRMDQRSESARCIGGVCVYLAAIANPNTAPCEQLRAVVVAGQIERNGFTYESVIDAKFQKETTTIHNLQSSAFLQAYGHDMSLRLVVEETLASRVLEAAFLISAHPTHQSSRVNFHVNSQSNSTATNLLAEGGILGPSEIRRKIIRWSFATPCASRMISTRTVLPSMDMVTWSGPCSAAADILGYNTETKAQVCPSPEEWILVTGDSSRQEVLRSSYALYYTIICSDLSATNMILTTTACLICTLESISRGVSQSPAISRVALPPNSLTDQGENICNTVVVYCFRDSPTFSIKIMNEAWQC
ncbi:hypothetical protein NA56DRAFT_648244 [Hyaloscypha hepaticicola]|uniref:Uncharacterized protein n=1 Tax=Hyaloscypha hepaticicola TaxID=2082293 RepID=A0A2J6PVN6_9HELO|nr:hypothetical protein NA56DRAFT_648244 [Hyaloscypha hepaticicola]